MLLLKGELFDLGEVRCTQNAYEVLEGAVSPLIQRHAAGDWGDLIDAHDAAVNARALKDGSRIISAYTGQGNNYRPWPALRLVRASDGRRI